MPTLYVENIPEELYEALRRRAKAHRNSIAAEILHLLEQNVPTPSELKRRRKLFEELKKTWSAKASSPDPVPTAEELVREDRQR